MLLACTPDVPMPDQEADTCLDSSLLGSSAAEVGSSNAGQ